MYLKSLTLRGFKSFASSTTLRLEPGITCVVGPNGSGKSNVVDALTWVMGEQGAKALRGGKMQDVIFAGTAGRAALGRAEVTLTIDNSDGALPIDYSEVSITRRMFRDGAGEYEINGSSCRLMDVQELLSDSGIGREMHVIVGQGRLSAILESRPEDRRAFIEEAAGVLKHRKRKEKAVRKLDSMQANLARLTDLTGELRRQLKPLGRQAEVARRAQTIQSDLRDARLRLAADDLVTRRAELTEQSRGENLVREQHAEATALLEDLTAIADDQQQALARVAPAAENAARTWFRLSALAERTSATIRIAGERARNLTREPEQRVGEDPDELEARAERIALEEAELLAAVDTARDTLDAIRGELADRERAASDAERAHLAAVRAAADRREGLARLGGQVATARARVESIDAEMRRGAEGVEHARERADAARIEFEQVQTQVESLTEGEESLDAGHERAAEALRAADERVAELRAGEREVGQRVASLRARIEALQIGLRRKDGAAWLLDHRADLVTGRLSERIRVADGYEIAVSAVLGMMADAVTVASVDAAGEAVTVLLDADAGRAVLVFPDTDDADPDPAPEGSRRLIETVEAPSELLAALRRTMADTCVVDDLDRAVAISRDHPRWRAVTRAGALVGAGWVIGGSDRAPSTIEVQSAIDTSTVELAAAERELEQTAAALTGAAAELDDRRELADQALAALRESDAAISAVYEQLGRLGQVVRSAEAEIARLIQQRDTAESGRTAVVTQLAELEERLRLAESESEFDGDVAGDGDPLAEEREIAAEALAAARATEVEARLAVRTSEERADALRGRADRLRSAARAEREARSRAARAAEERRRAAVAAGEVEAVGRELADRVDRAVTVAAAHRDRLEAVRGDLSRRVDAGREEMRKARERVTALTDSLHRDEVARAEAALRYQQLENAALEQFAMTAEDLIAEYGPDIALPPSELEIAEYEQAKERGEAVSRPAAIPYDRATQQRRLARAEKDLKALGRVNPLALEEFAALEERYNFLSTQLEDVKAARKDLLAVIDDVDARILQVFADAYADVEREFVQVFATLFPGGEGRLILTDPSDMLTTGVEVEARPPGKKVKRLSLLSGGEKSLTAVAMLVAIFRARPSPFYVMDEVEAALDDTNLRRLISLFEQLRERSQLIVITHQKATMEVADALYGVSMRGDGITTVISQRLRGRDVAISVGEGDPLPDPATPTDEPVSPQVEPASSSAETAP